VKLVLLLLLTFSCNSTNNSDDYCFTYGEVVTLDDYSVIGECHHSRLFCNYPVWERLEGQGPSPEVCDGLDNDCDVVAVGSSVKRSVMVLITIATDRPTRAFLG
jgi:hypothetical protein